MKKILIILLTIFLNLNAFSQDKFKNHVIEEEETLDKIAEKFKVTPYDILKINTNFKKVFKVNGVLKIPMATRTKTELLATKHVIGNTDTPFSLSKKYGVSVEDLRKANPSIKDVGLKNGQKITIPRQKNDKIALKEGEELDENGKPILIKKEDEKAKDKKNETAEVIIKNVVKQVRYQVVAGDTAFSVAKHFGITIGDLETENPEIIDGLQIGMSLKISSKSTVVETKSTNNSVTKATKKTIGLIDYEVKPKETLYSLSKKFDISQAEISALNPQILDGLQIGMLLKLPSSATAKDDFEKVNNGLSQTFSGTSKKMFMLLPFNLEKVEKDTTITYKNKIKKDKFLNMTLDFYSGAMMAIDSAKSLGINVDITILDSQETKTTSNIENLIAQHDMASADVVLGPFYQANVEQTASILMQDNVPVISPLSKESNTFYRNLILSTPATDYLKPLVFSYLNSKNANIVAVYDTKKTGIKDYIRQKEKEVKQVAVNEKNEFVKDSIAIVLEKNRLNFVILDADKTGTITKIINFLSVLQKEYDIQLVVLEKNDALDFDEISITKMAKLKMIYPSLTKDFSTAENIIFEKKFKEKNKIYPNYFAVRGFDLTFDTLMRLAQEKNYVETLKTIGSEQVENKFEYHLQSSGTFINKGAYLFFYDTDLTIKEIKI